MRNTVDNPAARALREGIVVGLANHTVLIRRDGVEHPIDDSIRDHAWGAAIVMVAITGWGQEEDREQSHAAGFDLHLVKPVDHDELLRVVGSARPRAST